MPHTTRGTNRREECCERGYYHLHRQLNHTLLLHSSLTVALLVCGGSQHVGEGSLLLEALLLATDGALLALHEVAEGEDAVLLERAARQLLALRVLRDEVDVDAVDHRLGTTGHSGCEVRLAQLLAVHCGRERPESVELHGLTLRQQFLHAVHHLTEHQHAHLVVRDLAVTGHVGGKALQVQRLLRIALSKVLAVSGTVIVLVLPQVNHHWNFTSCHFFILS